MISKSSRLGSAGALLRRRHATRLRSLRIENLEARQLLAVDFLEPAAFGETSFTDSRHPKLSAHGGRSAAPHHYVVDGEKIGMVIASNRLAIDPIDAAVRNPQLLAEFGLEPIRSVGEQFQVYASASSLTKEKVQTLVGSGLVERVVPVFTVLESRSEAVLLNEAIVALQPGVSAEEFFENHPAISGYQRLHGTPDQYVVTMAGGYGTQSLEGTLQLQGDERLQWAIPNFYQSWETHYIPNDARFNNLWHLHNTGQGGGLVDADSDLPEAWDVIPGGSADITIAVVDSGVSTDHPDLKLWVNPGEIPFNGVDDDGNGWVDDVNGWNFVSNNNVVAPNTSSWNDSHGTSVAGVAAARGDNAFGVTGAAYLSQVLGARIFEGNNVASDANIAGAIYYAAGRTANGTGTWKAADLANHSWGGGAPSTAINTALSWATSQGRQGKGATQLFSSGNGFGLVGNPANQAAVNPGIVVVGAMNNFGEKSDYSSFGPLVDVVTPSSDTRSGYLAIDTTDRLGAAGYSSEDYTGTGATGFGGTSSAAPLASGIAALAIARGQQLGIDLTPTQIRNLLRVNTDLMGTEYDYDPVTGKSFYMGYGSLNAGSLVRAIGSAEISVVSGSEELFDGLSLSDLGSAMVGDVRDFHFRVRNQGTQELDLADLTISSGPIEVAEGFGQSLLGVGESTTFTLRFAPTSSGSTTQTVTILSNDADEESFQFDVQANGVRPMVSGHLFEDWNGDGVQAPRDPGIANGGVFLDQNDNGIFDEVTLIQEFSTSPNAPIQDLTILTSTMLVEGVSGLATDVDVLVNISHTYLYDLDLVLIHPSGLRIPLAIGVGDDGDDFTNTIFDDEAAQSIWDGSPPYTGSFRPQSPLAALDGLDANGGWKLEVTDFFGGDEGTLHDWGLFISTGERVERSSDNGFFYFEEIGLGTHRMMPITSADWMTTGAAEFMFEVTSPSDVFPNVDFGLAKGNRWYGQIFDDVNVDGIPDSQETGVSGRHVYWDRNANGMLDETSETEWTDTTPVELPDLTTSTSTITVAGTEGTITDIDVTLNISHTWVADLEIYLIGPDGTRVELLADVGGDGDDFVGTVLDDQADVPISEGSAPFTGRYRPEGLLAAFNGLTSDGDWVLEITDIFQPDPGILQSWSIAITTEIDFIVASEAHGNAYIDLSMGQQQIGLVAEAPWVTTFPASGLMNVEAMGMPLFEQWFGTKQAPLVSATTESVTGVEGDVVVQDGMWSTPYPDEEISLTASVGEIEKHSDGTWSWSMLVEDDQAAAWVTISATDPYGIQSSTQFELTVANRAPEVEAALPVVSGNVLSVFSNSGTWSDVPADVVTLTASLGQVTKNGDGTWSWSMTPSQAYTSQLVTITASDEDGGTSHVSFTIDALVAVVNRRVFYNASGFETVGGVGAALDASKILLRSSSVAQATTAANVINYSRGINGVVLDVAGLAGSGLSASDFLFRVAPSGASGVVNPSTWASAPTPNLIDVTPGTSTTPARVRLEWANNAIQNTWLQIIVLANANTGLANREVYYLGHSLGDVDYVGPTYRVTTNDVALVRAGVSSTPVGISDARDVDKDRRVTTNDVAFVRGLVSNTPQLRAITIPASGSSEEGEGGTGGLMAAPGVVLPQSGVEGVRPIEIKARMTGSSYDVPLPAGRPSVDAVWQAVGAVDSVGTDRRVGRRRVGRG
jgi:large repetitive protein